MVNTLSSLKNRIFNKPMMLQALKDYGLGFAVYLNYLCGLDVYCWFFEDTMPLYLKRGTHFILGFILLSKLIQQKQLSELSQRINWLVYGIVTWINGSFLIHYIAGYKWPKMVITNFFVMVKIAETFDWIYIALNVASVFVCIYALRLLYENKDTILKTTHGSAQLSSAAELRKLHYDQGIPIGHITNLNPIKPVHEQMKSISKPHQGELIRLNPDHILVVAPSGSGKGVGIVIPTLLDYQGPVIVTDVKAAENYHVSANYRKSLGRIVYAFDPYGLTGQESCSINILDYLDVNSPELVDEVADIASLICPLPSNDYGNSKFFAEQAAALIQCLILFVLYYPPLESGATLKSVYVLLCKDHKEFMVFLNQIVKDDFCYGIPARLAATFLSPGKEELGSTLSTARTSLRFIDTPLMDKLTATTTFNVDELLNNQADLYICIRSESLDVQKRMVQLLLSAIFLKLRKQVFKPTPPVLFLIDEMPFLGHIAQIEKALLIGRGYGVKVMAIAQTLSSLKQVYRDSWETMLASNLTVFFGVSDVQTAEYVSKMMGKQTVETESSSKSSNKGRNNQSQGTGLTLNTTGRPLLTPEEIRTLPEHILLAFQRGKNPMLLEKICYYTSKIWKNRYSKNPLEG